MAKIPPKGPNKSKAPKDGYKYAVDAFRAKLSREELEEFEELGKFRPKVKALFDWLVARGYEGTIDSVATWRKNNYLTGVEAKIINELAHKYDGIEVTAVLGMAVGNAAAALNTILTKINEKEIMERIATTDPDKLLAMIPALLRESRSASSDLGNIQYVQDRHELVMTGVNALAEQLKLVFKDTAFESALSDGIIAGIKQIEGK